MKKVQFFALFFVFFCGVLSAQSADKVTEMLELKTVNLGDVAYFAATYFDIIEEDGTGVEAISQLEKHFQYSKISDEKANLRYDQFAYFCTQTWNIKGGLMLMATKAPRYAFKELQAMGYISQSVSPSDEINGVQALTIITSCIEYSEENETINLASF